jgi:hypothetical protein
MLIGTVPKKENSRYAVNAAISGTTYLSLFASAIRVWRCTRSGRASHRRAQPVPDDELLAGYQPDQEDLDDIEQHHDTSLSLPSRAVGAPPAQAPAAQAAYGAATTSTK